MTTHKLRVLTIPYADGTRTETAEFTLNPTEEIVNVTHYADAVILTVISTAGPYTWKATADAD